MRVLSSRKSETSTQVLLQSINLVDSSQEAGIEGLLVSLSLLADHVLGLLFLSEELASLLSLSRALEVGIVNFLGNGDTGDIDLGGGGDNVRLVDSADGDTVNLEGTRDQQETRGELLKEDNTLSGETTSKNDQDGSGCDGLSQLCLSRSGLANSTARRSILSRVPTRSLFGNSSLASVEILNNGSGGSLLLLGGGLPLGGLLGELASLAEHGTSGVTRNTGDEFLVSGSGGLSGHPQQPRKTGIKSSPDPITSPARRRHVF